MEKVDNALVLAIAICIVRNKPSEQSLASYILDLREKFPLQPKEVPTRAEQDQWRIRALALEKENESLKLRLQKHEIGVQHQKDYFKNIESNQLRTELLAAKTSKQTDNPSSSQASAPKKKRKVESKATVADPTSLRRLLDELGSGILLHASTPSRTNIDSSGNVRAWTPLATGFVRYSKLLSYIEEHQYERYLGNGRI